MRRRHDLRARLLAATVLGALATVSTLIVAFNLALDSSLRASLDGLLRDRAAAQLRTVDSVDGRLRVREAVDQAAPDTQTWIFAQGRTLEAPAAPAAVGRAATALASDRRSFVTVAAGDARLHGISVVAGGRRLGTLVVGASLRPYRSSAHTALVGSLILGVLTVVALIAVSAWVIARALAPVARMTALAGQWSEHDLSKRFFAGQPHDEITALAATFDRLLERQAQSLRREQRVTAEISHELRTPLARIAAEAELAVRRQRDPESYRAALRAIGVAAEDLGRALDTLLNAARAAVSNEPRWADATAVAERAAAHSRVAAARPEVDVAVTPADGSLRVAVEAELAQRALAPVIDNAIRFARGRVRIVLRAEGERVLFEVTDDGPGVAGALHERIFAPGSTGESAAGGAGSGAGLGLALARRLAGAAGGEVACLPAEAGARFAVRLPSA